MSVVLHLGSVPVLELKRMIEELDRRLVETRETWAEADKDLIRVRAEAKEFNVSWSENIEPLKRMIDSLNLICECVREDTKHFFVPIDHKKIAKQIIMLKEIIAKTELRDKALCDYLDNVDEKNRITFEIMCRLKSSPTYVIHPNSRGDMERNGDEDKDEEPDTDTD